MLENLMCTYAYFPNISKAPPCVKCFNTLTLKYSFSFRLWMEKTSGKPAREVNKLSYMDILPKEIRGTEGIEPESLDTLLKSFNAETPIPGQLMLLYTIFIGRFKTIIFRIRVNKM